MRKTQTTTINFFSFTFLYRKVYILLKNIFGET